MRRSQPVKATENKENVYSSKCMCPGNPERHEYTRKSDRFPLGNLQDSDGQKQYLTVDYSLKVTRNEKTVPARSKSLCQSLDLSPNSLPNYAESTRISKTPSFKQPLTKLPPTVSIRPLQKGEFQKLLSQATQVCVSQAKPIRVRSKSCRCPGNAPSTTETTGREKNSSGKSSDDVFLQPTSTKIKKSCLPSPSYVNIGSTSTPYTFPSQKSSKLHDIPQKRSSSQNRTTETDKLLPSIKIEQSIWTGQSAGRTSNYDGSDSTLQLKCGSSISSIRSQNTPSAKTSLKKEQGTQESVGYVSWITPNSLSSIQKSNSSSSRSQINQTSKSSSLQNSTSSTNQRKRISSTSTSCTQKTQNSSSRYSLQNSSVKTQGCCSTRSVPNPKVSSSKYYETLPSQNFVTLSQDTLKTTIGASTSELESITSGLSKVQMTREPIIFMDEEKTFMDGEKFFKDLEKGKNLKIRTIPVCSPLSINLPLRRSNSTSEPDDNKKIRQPAIKSTLKRRNSTKKQIYYPLLYSPDYLEDILAYSYSNINRFLLKNELIEVYVNKHARTRTINWLIQVAEAVLPHVVDPVYYMTVRIFDYTIVKLKLRNSQYQLAAVVAFWISVKYLDTNVFLKIPKIYSLCNGKYSKEEILLMERTILKSVNFCLNISDPMDFLYNYLKSSNLEENELLKFGSKFVMECATLFENYPLVKAPFMAASALYFAYRIILKSKDVYVNFDGLERKSIEKYADTVIKLNVQYSIMERYEPVNKYLSPEKLNVAKYFL